MPFPRQCNFKYTCTNLMFIISGRNFNILAIWRKPVAKDPSKISKKKLT